MPCTVRAARIRRTSSRRALSFRAGAFRRMHCTYGTTRSPAVTHTVTGTQSGMFEIDGGCESRMPRSNRSRTAGHLPSAAVPDASEEGAAVVLQAAAHDAELAGRSSFSVECHEGWNRGSDRQRW